MDEYSDRHKWKPSIHLRRSHSRIDLEITGVRVERVQDISEADAESEWVFEWAKAACAEDNPYELRPLDYFEILWCSIHGREYWVANPLVWVVEFRKIKP